LPNRNSIDFIGIFRLVYKDKRRAWERVKGLADITS
jgi:hypothetical protein